MASKPVEGEIVRVGRPPKLTKIERQEVYDALVDYIARTPDPTIVGFCAYDPVAARHMITRNNLNDWEEFSTLQKYCIEKQEAYLLQAGGTGRYNPTMAIFRLKQPQHGYTDKSEVDNNVTVVSPIVGGMAKAELSEGDDDATD